MAALLAAYCGEASACLSRAHDVAYLAPFLRPVPGEIVETFGLRYHPLLNARRVHNGIDFAAEVGLPLAAAATGVIVSAGNEGAPGIAILIRHEDGWETFYSHLSRLAVRAGDCVKRGDLIGYSGSTGFTVGRILHFEVRHYGTPIDPASLFAPPVPQ